MQRYQSAIQIKKRARMQTAGRGECRLGRAQPVWQRSNHCRGNPHLRARGVAERRMTPNYFCHHRLSAEPATAGRENMPRQPVKIHRLRTRQQHIDRRRPTAIRPSLRRGTTGNVKDIHPLRHHALAEQKPSRQLAIPARRAHGHRHRASFHPDFQRRLHRDRINGHLAAGSGQPLNRDGSLRHGQWSGASRNAGSLW